jgi:hypothetical protein
MDEVISLGKLAGGNQRESQHNVDGLKRPCSKKHRR